MTDQPQSEGWILLHCCMEFLMAEDVVVDRLRRFQHARMTVIIVTVEATSSTNFLEACWRYRNVCKKVLVQDRTRKEKEKVRCNVLPVIMSSKLSVPLIVTTTVDHARSIRITYGVMLTPLTKFA